MSPTTPADRRMLASLAPMAAVDLGLFLRLMLLKPGMTHDPMAKVHCEMQEHLTNHRLALVELPRDHGKTTQVCWRVLWELGRNPNLRVRIVCASEAIVRDREMMEFPFAQHDDLLNAAATGMNHLLLLRCEPRIWDFAA